MFLLVPAYPGCPGSKAVKRSLLLLLYLKVFYTVSEKNGIPEVLAITLSNLSYFQWCHTNGNKTDVLMHFFKANSQFLLIVFIVCVCAISDKTDKSLQSYSNLHRGIAFFPDRV